MGKLKKTNLVVIIVGVLSILFAVFALINGSSFGSQLWGLFLGVVLIGTALIDNQNQEAE